MTALPSAPTHAMIILEMLGAATIFGGFWVHQDDIARRLYPEGRPTHYAESIRSTIQKVRKRLAETDAGVVADGGRYTIAVHIPGVFRSGAGFRRRPVARQPVKPVLPVRHVTGTTRRAGRG